MFRALSVLSLSASAVASSLNDADQTLPAINVKFDFPSSSTLVSARELLEVADRDAVFAKRVQHAEEKTMHLSQVLQQFAREVDDQLGTLASIVQPVANSQELPPSFLQMVAQKQHVAGVSMNDVEELARDAESASKLYASAAQSGPTPLDEQRSILAGNVDALGAVHAQLLHEKHAMDEAGNIAHCASCARDHDELCPDGWSEAGSGHCSGPSDYDGPCVAFANFAGLSAKDKTEYERTCFVCWPCHAASGASFLQMMKDVNEPPFPTVNVIVDQPVTDAVQADRLRGARSAQWAFLERVVLAQQGFESSVGIVGRAQEGQLDKLRQMNARITALARNAR
jgi:CPW-WPC domain-containing protein